MDNGASQFRRSVFECKPYSPYANRSFGRNFKQKSSWKSFCKVLKIRFLERALGRFNIPAYLCLTYLRVRPFPL